MADFGHLNIYGSLNVKENLFVRNNIIQDDILYPSMSVVSSAATASIYIKILKNDNTFSNSVRPVNFNTNYTVSPHSLMPARPAIHWWISNSDMGQPQVVSGTTVNIRILKGTMLEPINSTNTAVLRTSLTDATHSFDIRVETNTSAVRYIMCAIQGKVYSKIFST